MVCLLDQDVQTKEVLGWRGVHLFHFVESSCSKKLRIFLNIKGIAWNSHHINLAENENLTSFFLGINPRGLVPVLVHDGQVHIESNDILMHLEKAFPDPPLVPHDRETEVERLLKFEDDLHLDLRALSLRFLFALKESPKSERELDAYATMGSGTVLGRKDASISREIGFWRDFAENGVSDDDARRSAERFNEAFAEVDRRLSETPYILGATATLVDIAWAVYASRLEQAGYPLARLHTHLAAWFQKISDRPEFARELALPDFLAAEVDERRITMQQTGQTMEAICFAGESRGEAGLARVSAASP